MTPEEPLEKTLMAALLPWLVLYLVVLVCVSHWAALKAKGISGFANGDPSLQIIGFIVGGGIILVPFVILLMAGNGP